MANGTSDGSGARVQSVDRALTILGILARLGEAGVTEIAGELGVHKSTAFRLVATLESHGMVEQNEDRGKYRLGVGVLRLAGATTARLDVVQEARPICRKLAADSGETVNIAVLSDRSALYLDQVAGQSALQSHNWVGQHIPLHATSNGKVLLSGLSSDEVDNRLPRLPSYTADTVTTPGPAAPRAGRGPRAGVRRRRRRARGRADRDRGADPQRARRRDRLDERLRPDLPARRGRGSRSSSRWSQDAADEVSRRLGLRNVVAVLDGLRVAAAILLRRHTSSCDIRN